MKLWLWCSIAFGIQVHVVYAQQRVVQQKAQSFYAIKQVSTQFAGPIAIHATEHNTALEAYYPTLAQRAQQLQKNACLLVAVFKGDLKRVTQLVQDGADPSVCDDWHNAPAWIIAIFEHKMDIADVLLRAKPTLPKVDCDDEMGGTAFMLAAKFDYPKIMELLKERGAQINKRDHAGFAALWYAVHNQAFQALDYLLSLDDIDLTIKDGGGKMVLQYAARRNLAKVVGHLLRRTDIPLSDKNAALREASERGYVDIGLMLIRAGAVPSPKEPIELSFSNKNSVSNSSFEIVDNPSLRTTPSDESMQQSDESFLQSDSERSDSMNLTPTLHDDIFESIAYDSITLTMDAPHVPVA